jgi:hypothetical protein
MGGGLAAHIAAINELKDSLDELSLSPLARDGDTCTFSVTAPAPLGRCDFSLTVGGEYPAGAGLLVCTNAEVPGLEQLNERLAGRCSLGRALALLGQRLHVDLSWAEEAAGGSGSEDEDEDMAASRDGSASEAGSGGEEDAMEDDVIREWSRRLVQ